MKRKIVLLLVSCLMAVSLVLASCAPAVVEEEEKAPVVEEKKPVVEEKKPVVEEKEMVRDTLGRLVEKPKYGGTLTYVFYKAQLGYDVCFTNPGSMYRVNLIADDLVMGDWAKGPSGTGEMSWECTRSTMWDEVRRGSIAESWETIDPVTRIYHIRKGVHFQNKPPANGREVTADDVVYNLERYYTVPTSYLLAWTPVVPESIKALDRYTVEVKAPDPVLGPWMFDLMQHKSKIFPPEAIEKYGNMQDWHNVCGTGPFIVTDEVAGTSTTMVKNPNFWEMDPLHPENRLPYYDQVNWVIITDGSTRLAAIRTRKGDLCRGIGWEDAAMFKTTNPDLQFHEYSFTATYVLNIRMDNPELPWYDKRVRQALALAINNLEIKDEFYGGQADMLASPVLPLAECKDWYVPLEELPQNVRELYEYHPDKAKKLLAEAGYADGFKVNVMCRIRDVDMLSMIKAYWADIGVEMEIDVKEGGVFYSVKAAKTFPEMYYYCAAATTPEGFADFFEPGITGFNLGEVNDAKINEAAKVIRENYYDTEVKFKAIKDILPYILDQQYHIQPPNYHLYYLAQPWVKHWMGEYSMGYYQYYMHFRYLWIDEDLKKEMGY